MTRDEAIFELGYAKDFQTPKRKEAIDMAIEALSTEREIIRCKDCRCGKKVCGNIECFADSYAPDYHGYEWFCPNGEQKGE